MTAPNIFDPADEASEEPGYRFRRRRLGQQLGSERIGASVYELDPGERTWPYHWHHGNEELAIVLAGSVVLREPDGERTLGPGDAAAFRIGPAGAHQFRNESAEPARLLIVSTKGLPDISEYPDSGKLGLFGTSALGGGETGQAWIPAAAEVDYYTGEKLS